jgi:erythromycin esterase
MKYPAKIAVSALLIILSAAASARAEDKLFLNLDFEKANAKNKPKLWYAGGEGYEAKLDETEAVHGKKSLLMENTSPNKDFAALTTYLEVKNLTGKKITFSGYIKTSAVKDGYAGLWIRVDGKPKQVLAFDNMEDRGITGTTGWKKYTIEFPVAPEATNINLGGIFTGKGKAWFDNFELLADGKSYGNDEPVIPEPQKNEVEWLKNNLITVKTVKPGNGFEDLKPVGNIVGDARLVSLGEATHGSKEIFQMKHRLIEYLATEKGFDIFAIEAAMPEAYRLNDFVLHGKGDPKKLIAGMYFWTWNTAEVLDMVLWMRRFNESGKGKIQFTGFDMQSISAALENLRDFAGKNDKSLLPALDKIAETDDKVHREMEKTNIWQTPVHFYQDFLNDSAAIVNHITENKEKYLKVLSPYEYQWLKQNAVIIAEYSSSATKTEEKDFPFRDQCMAENIKWILDNNPKSKIVVWAHNGHVSKNEGNMGGFLKTIYGDSLKVFGFAVGQGTYTARDTEKGLNSDNPLEIPEAGSAEYYLRSTGNPLFILDLKKAKADNPDSKWLFEDKPLRSIGYASMEEQFFPDNLSRAFDAVIYIDKTSSSVLLKKKK